MTYQEKICTFCDQHENPFGDYCDGTPDNPENFGSIHWIGTNNCDDAHQECIWKEKQ